MARDTIAAQAIGDQALALALQSRPQAPASRQMIASIVRRSSLRGRARRSLTAAIAVSNLAHWASVRT
jgi:hypothetical protein